jgi:endonuclease/exonuclease/phosphatase family metal-dependent hydrolase
MRRSGPRPPRLASAILLATCCATSACAWRDRVPPRSTAVEIGTDPRADDGSAGDRLRVVTFNVAMQDARAIGGALLRSPELRAADVIFLQEVEAVAGEPDSRAAQVARQLRLHHAYAPAFGRSDGGSHGVAILSRYPLSEIRVMELPRRDLHYNSRRRVALAATIRIGAQPVRLYCVHLDLRVRSRDRVTQLEPVLRAASRGDTPVVIGGDFNTTPFTWLWRVVPVPGGRHGRKLEAFVRSRGFDTPLVASGPTSPWLGMRLDGLYTRDLAALTFGVDRSVRISDHLPVWADLSWSRGRGSGGRSAGRSAAQGAAEDALQVSAVAAAQRDPGAVVE